MSPREAEKFYLRVLLHHVRGATSFENLRTVHGITRPTFQEACIALGLLENDQQWNDCLIQATAFRLPHALRLLFSIILLYSDPTNPFELWLSH